MSTYCEREVSRREQVYKFDWSLVASVLTDTKTYEDAEEDRGPITRRVTASETVAIDALISLMRGEADAEETGLLHSIVLP